MKVIVELRDGTAVERKAIDVGVWVEQDDPHYAVRIVDVVDDEGNGAHCEGCGNDDGPTWCGGVVEGDRLGVTM